MKYEKEMIPLLNEFIIKEMGYKVVLNEFDSGYGIADIIATTESQNHKNFPFNSILDIHLLENIPLNKWISFKDIKINSFYSEKHLKFIILKKFIESGYLIREKNEYNRIKAIPKPKNSILAVEAKLRRWKEGLIQVLRYKKYADYCYVALLENFIKNVDIELFKTENIGILSVNSDKEVIPFLEAVKNKHKSEKYVLFANKVLSAFESENNGST